MATHNLRRLQSLHHTVSICDSILPQGETGLAGLVLHKEPLDNIFCEGKVLEMRKVNGKKILHHKGLVGKGRVLLLESSTTGKKIVGFTEFIDFLDFGEKGDERKQMLYDYQHEHHLSDDLREIYVEADHLYGLKMANIHIFSTPRTYVTKRGQQSRHRNVCVL